MNTTVQTTAESFVYQLKRAADNHQNVRFHFSDTHHVTVLGTHGRYHCHDISIDSLAKARPSDYQVEVLSDSCTEIKNAAQYGRPLQELMWRTAYSISAGALLPGCNRDDVIKLNEWPNLTRLSRSPNICRIAALFSARPTSIELAARILAVPLEELFQFYSAAAYAGYTTAINKPAETLRLKPHRRQSLIKKLMVRLTQTG